MKKLLIITLLGAFFAPSFAYAQSPTPLCIRNPKTQSCATDLPPVFSTAQESGHLFKNSEGVTAGFQVNNFLTANGLQIFALDANAIPSNSTLATCTGLASQPTPCIMKTYGIAAAPSSSQSATLGANWAPGPNLHYYSGFVLVCSSTAPPTLTLSANCMFSAEIE